MSELDIEIRDVTIIAPVADADTDVRELTRIWGDALEAAGRSWEALIVYDLSLIHISEPTRPY